MYISRLKIIFCILVSNVIFIQANAHENKVTVPNWLVEPVNERYIGFIGSSNALSVAKNGSKLKSRARALASYSLYAGITLPEFSDEQLLKDKVIINDATLRFAPEFERDMVLYSYAYHLKATGINRQKADKPLTKKTTEFGCDFKQCQPAWLCEQGNNIVGVSQVTGNPGTQLEKARSNAEYIAQFLNYSDVEFSNVIKSYYSNSMQSRIALEDSQVTTKQFNARLLHTASCYSQGYVYSQFKLPGPLKYPTKSNWLHEPNHNGLTGVVGSFNGFLPDGRIKTAVNLAIKNGLLALAKTKNINVTNQAIFKESDGHVFIEHTTETGSSIIKATLNAIKIEENSYGFTIHVWLLDSQ